MANPITHKANSVRFCLTHLNRSTILLSRFSKEPARHYFRDEAKVMSDRLLAQMVYPGLSPKGVTSLTLFPSLPYHPPHAPNPNHPHYQQHGGRLGGVPR